MHSRWWYFYMLGAVALAVYAIATGSPYAVVVALFFSAEARHVDTRAAIAHLQRRVDLLQGRES